MVVENRTELKANVEFYEKKGVSLTPGGQVGGGQRAEAPAPRVQVGGASGSGGGPAAAQREDFRFARGEGQDRESWATDEGAQAKEDKAKRIADKAKRSNSGRRWSNPNSAGWKSHPR